MTYFAFSRALHLMKNSGAKVRRAGWSKDDYYLIRDDMLYKNIKGKERLGECYEQAVYSDDILANDWELYHEY